jgi:multidrug resistance efflux pump
MSATRRLAIVTGIAFVAGGAALLAGPRFVETPAKAIGMVRQTEIHIAPETTGRLASLAVAPGEKVKVGDVLATLSNPELAASVQEARSALASTKAERDRVFSGVRAEEVAIAAQAAATAEANLVLAQAQYDRAAALAQRGFASRQQLDDDTASLAKARADLDLKRAQHDEASAGPTKEQRELAEAKVALAAASLATLEAELGKLTLVSPADGTVGIQIAEPGEILVAGKPVMTLEPEGERWFGFTLREDALGPLNVGSDVALTAADGHSIPARVTELRPLGEFATWRAARAVGDHDLNSFRLRIEPVAATDALQPGMSVWLPRAATP